MKKVSVFIVLLFATLFITTTKVEAREIIQESIITSIKNSQQVGSITLYDDYVVKIGFEYGIKEVNITSCLKMNCQSDTMQTYNPNQEYFDGDHIEISLNEHFDFISDNEYTINVFVKFKPYASAITDVATGNITGNILYKESAIDIDSENKYVEEILTSAQKVERVFRYYVIPLIYMVLGVTFIVKGVLLGIDITKHADDPAIRKEKIIAFVYFGVALFLIAILNTVAAFYVDLFG